MTDLTDFVKLLTALVSLLTALIGLTEALKQCTKQKKRGRRLSGIDPLIEVTALPSIPPLGLLSTLFYPRAPGLTNGISVTKSGARPGSPLYSSHHSTSTEHSTSIGSGSSTVTLESADPAGAPSAKSAALA